MYPRPGFADSCANPYLLGQIGLVGNLLLSACITAVKPTPYLLGQIGLVGNAIASGFVMTGNPTLPIRSNRISWKQFRNGIF